MKTLLVLASLLCLPLASHGQSANLKGVGGVLLVCTVDKDLIDAGVGDEAIQTSFELKLRNLGLLVFDIYHTPTPDELIAERKLNVISLFVRVEGMKIEGTEIYCYDYSIDAVEMAARRSTPTAYSFVTTWSKSNIGYFSKNRADAPKTNIDSTADFFCNDYLIANPKPSPVAPK